MGGVGFRGSGMRRYSSRAGGSQHLLRHSARHLQQGRKPKSVCRQQSASIPSALLSTAGRTRCGDTATLVGERVLDTAARAATIISDAVGMAGCANFSPMDDTSRLASELPFQRLGRLTPNPAQFSTGPVSSARCATSLAGNPSACHTPFTLLVRVVRCGGAAGGAIKLAQSTDERRPMCADEV